MRITIEPLTAWQRSDLLVNKDFVYQLTPTDFIEIDSALERCFNYPITNITRNEFVLINLSKYIDQKLLPQIHSGIGVLCIKGLTKSKYTFEELSKIHWGLGLYFGKPHLQFGEYVLRVEDQGYQLREPGARNSNTSGKLWFHNDSCDITAMMCIQKAKRGGETRIVSALAIHNKMMENCPELLKTLYQPYYRTHRRISGLCNNEVHAKPIFTQDGGSFSCDISRPVIENAQKRPEVPKLSEMQVDALNMLESLAESPELYHEFFLEPADIIYINNHTMLHARTGFEDDVNPEKKRLLLRLHLNGECKNNSGI
jgi:hypothetical protein